MQTTTVFNITLIGSDPTLRSSRPIILGTSLEVADVVCAMRREPEPRTPEQVAESYRITPAQAYAAMAYYYEHQAEIEANIARGEALADELRAKGIGRPDALLSR